MCHVSKRATVPTPLRHMDQSSWMKSVIQMKSRFVTLQLHCTSWSLSCRNRATGYSAQSGHSSVQEPGKQRVTGYSEQASHSSVQEPGTQQATGYSAQTSRSGVQEPGMQQGTGYCETKMSSQSVTGYDTFQISAMGHNGVPPHQLLYLGS